MFITSLDAVSYQACDHLSCEFLYVPQYQYGYIVCITHDDYHNHDHHRHSHDHHNDRHHHTTTIIIAETVVTADINISLTKRGNNFIIDLIIDYVLQQFKH